MPTGDYEEMPAQVSAFDHENAIMHYSIANKRMLIALVTVCITFIITISVFVCGYTVREKNWLDTLSRLTTPNVEVKNGVQQQPH